ncbi:hypothetical protein C3L33_10209, partial [Rhododendron williamsianum]
MVSLVGKRIFSQLILEISLRFQDQLMHLQVLRAVDLSAHMDSVFGSGKDLEDEKAKHASALMESTNDMWQTSGATAPENKTIREDDDSFDIWNDFTSSKNAQDSSKDSLIQLKQRSDCFW